MEIQVYVKRERERERHEKEEEEKEMDYLDISSFEDELRAKRSGFS